MVSISTGTELYKCMLDSDGGNFCDQAPPKHASNSFSPDILPQFDMTQHTQNGQPPVTFFIIKNRVVCSSKRQSAYPHTFLVSNQSNAERTTLFLMMKMVTANFFKHTLRTAFLPSLVTEDYAIGIDHTLYTILYMRKYSRYVCPLPIR